MIQIVHLFKGLAQKNAGLPFVPLCQYRPDQTILGRQLDLTQARLPAALTLGPPRAVFQPKCRVAMGSSEGDILCIHLYGSRLLVRDR